MNLADNEGQIHHFRFSFMKHFVQLFLFLIISLNCVYGQQLNWLAEINDFGNNPGNLKMFVHSGVSKPEIQMPLVVVLHGCGENAKSASELSGWNKLADLNGFIVVYPQQKFSNNADLCFNWFKRGDIEKGKGECESIYQMISFAKQHYNIDSNRVFVTGFSAGAAMSVVMLATHPESFRSGAVFAGGAYKIANNAIEGLKAMLGKRDISKEILIKNVREQNPQYKSRYPQMIVYQGLDDLVVNQKNANTLINQWTGIHNADTIADKIEPSFSGVEDITRIEYNDSLGEKVLIYYKVNNLGHRLMIKPGEKDNECGRTGTFAVDRGFNSTYQTVKDFGILHKDQ